MTHRPAGWLACLALLLVALLCAAHAPKRVSLVLVGGADDRSAHVEQRLRAEMLELGYEPLTLTRPVMPRHEELSELARRTSSQAVVVVYQSDRHLRGHVWVAEEGATPVQREVEPALISREAPDVFAIRVAELVRASFLELQETPRAAPTAPSPRAAPPKPEPPPQQPAPKPPEPTPVKAPAAPAQPPAPPPPPNTSSGLIGGIALAAGPGGIPAGLGPTVAFTWTPEGSWVGELRLFGPIVSTLQADMGTVDLDQELLLARFRVNLLDNSPATPFLIAGVGAHRLGARGHAGAPYVADAGSLWSGAATAGGGLVLHLSHHLGLLVESSLLLTSSRPMVRIADERVWTGRPTFYSSFGAEIAW